MGKQMPPKLQKLDSDSTTDSSTPIAVVADTTETAPEPVVAATESPEDAASAAEEQQDAVLENPQVDENASADSKDQQLADATDLAESAASTASLMELESKIQQHMSGCAGEDCSHAYTAAFGLYKTTYTVNKANVEHFEKKRRQNGKISCSIERINEQHGKSRTNIGKSFQN